MATTTEERLAHLERRLARLEASAAVAPRCAPAIAVDLESTVGLTWLNRLGAGLVVAGLALGVGWANERGLLTPSLRCALVALTSLGALAAGARLLQSRDDRRRRFAHGVSAVGVFGLYLVPLMAAHLDPLIAPEQATGFSIALTLGLTLAARAWATPTLATLALFGALTIALEGGAASAMSVALVMTLYLTAAIAERRASAADHLAATAAALLGGWLTHRALGVSFSPAVAGAVCLGGAALVRSSSAPRGVVRLLFVLGALGVGVGLTGAASTTSAPSVAISVVLVGYGLSLVALGAAARSRLCRIAGVTGLGLAAGKLALHDVWHVPTGARVAAMFVLGLGLLAASFLYSRLAARFA